MDCFKDRATQAAHAGVERKKYEATGIEVGGPGRITARYDEIGQLLRQRMARIVRLE